MINEKITEKVLQLQDLDKIHLIELLCDSLDKPPPEIELLWAKESEARYAAYKAENIQTKTFDQIATKYG